MRCDPRISEARLIPSSLERPDGPGRKICGSDLDASGMLSQCQPEIGPWKQGRCLRYAKERVAKLVGDLTWLAVSLHVILHECTSAGLEAEQLC